MADIKPTDGPRRPSSESAEDEIRAKIEKIPSCKCSRSGCSPQYNINVKGDLVTQETIENLMKVLKEIKAAPGRWVNILNLYETKLTELDLTPLMSAHFDFLSISHNDLLTKIKGPPLNTGSGLIHANRLHISFNPLLTDEGFGDTLKYFDPATLQTLNLWGMKLEGSLKKDLKGQVQETVPEFLPGLSSLRELHSLELAMNQIGRLGGGQFRKNNKLSFLNLRKNDIDEIWEDALLFDDIESSDKFFEQSYQTIVIDLSECQLKKEFFIHNQLRLTTQRPIHLDLVDNKLDTLPGTIFEKFLNLHPQNELLAGDNQLTCGDERLNWLVSQKDKFEKRINFFNRHNPNTPDFKC